MPIISVEPRIRCDSSAKLTPPIAATSLMSLSPLKPASDEPKVKAFFSLEASLGPVDAARTPLIPPAPTESVEADATGFVVVPDVGVADVDATEEMEPVVADEDVAAPPT